MGADVGGTKIVAGLVAPDGSIVRRHRQPVAPSLQPDEVLAGLAECIRAVAESGDARASSVGVGVAAQVERASGSVVHAPNLRWRDYPLRDRLQAALGLPVVVENDARTITLGEWTYGEGAGNDNLLCLVIGTGVGGGAVVDGRLLEGAHHSTGEIGHFTFVHGGRPCHCPNVGCWEAYVSGWAIAERFQQLAREDPTAAGALLGPGGSVGHLDPLALEKAAEHGHPLASRFLRRLAEEFASGVVGLVNAFNPDLVIVGGKIPEGYPEFIPTAQRAVNERCQPPAAHARVRASRLGADAGILGAAELVRRRTVPGAA